MIYRHPDLPMPERQLSIPRKKDLPIGTRRALLRQLGLSREDVEILLRAKAI